MINMIQSEIAQADKANYHLITPTDTKIINKTYEEIFRVFI